MYYLFIMRQVICLFTLEKIPGLQRFGHLASDRNQKQTWACFSPWEPSQKISSRSVHVLFSYRGNKQTDRQTNASDSIIPGFRGDN